ncbi:unnamed protein product, partial [Mesorhabditis spiculigera]
MPRVEAAPPKRQTAVERLELEQTMKYESIRQANDLAARLKTIKDEGCAPSLAIQRDKLWPFLHARHPEGFRDAKIALCNFHDNEMARDLCDAECRRVTVLENSIHLAQQAKVSRFSNFWG